MVNGGNSIKQYHAAAINGAADCAPCILGCQQTANQRKDPEEDAQAVGDGIDQLFAPGILRKLPLSQFGSFHLGDLLFWMLGTGYV